MDENNWGDDIWPLILLLFAMENPNYPLPEPMHLYNPDLAPQTENMDDKYPHMPIRPELTNPHPIRADQVVFDDFSIDQLRKATMNKKATEEYEKMITKEAMDTGHSIESLREEYEKALEDEAGYSGLFHFGDD